MTPLDHPARNLVLRWLLALVMLASAPLPALALAQPQTTPAWEQLSPAQREQLTAPLRERWNSQPQARARMLRNAQRWQQLSPQQRQRAQRGLQRLQQMTPQQRQQARAVFRQLRQLPDDERRALRERLKQMTPQQRRAWMQNTTPDKP